MTRYLFSMLLIYVAAIIIEGFYLQEAHILLVVFKAEGVVRAVKVLKLLVIVILWQVIFVVGLRVNV